MKLRILSIGHKMPNWVQQGFEEYLKRIQPMISVEMVELPPAKRSKTPSPAEIDKYKAIEATTILNAKHPKERLWLLEVKGKMLSTEHLSDKLSMAMQDGADIALVIGGADGVSPEILQAADFKWSLSELTLPHPLVRIIVIEQLYRAMSLINHHPYHRGG
ncbi:23S rRNA (pseudouridine(1915)-N(3))-methyltransferase RlmH [Moraxella catarrhalis]|jgi:rRNA large subunit m3Psi methyltransferase rlmH|uniref:23S rRNA (pseudouridine(1915)-N(3))-methyltransferase RlmH n=1 Tax=Moraxella catarrhalis TaxID=480 RepID=UPI000202AFB8|nr:23S rRNA (pseudouridine(1915)-N(3))-methyltransferase RlmH [Moraxella catarrhalis]EGE09744.1 rRNA large subunit methyltransferase [Moraxella catarrhalis 7169]MCG6815099.1 23S rRNA (pseudouridine(1915)-N(3))-methyltransferase RlmH [Moraxella catarrhalis]MPX14065.1 23S rRNA (pseudouridine(1915)-N(3))-methyltransferase RlmH [Moraxella catarrhalis]MPX28110.1 23S rRNA (pseudouridine(1915)-N(3))-methyltransferase RlmH [Moraxella catarrhalis]MPX38192.1 23S rRNA (pseudouridine(1915)-N(3))-methyltra